MNSVSRRGISTTASSAGLICLWLGVASALTLAAAEAAPVNPTGGNPASGTPSLALELNKLETVEKGCRAYIVVTNTSETAYQALQLDLVLFQPDGVIGRRVSLDLAPLKAAKRAVRLYDLEGLACDKIGSILVNEVIECRSDAGPITDCLASVSLSSLAPAKLTK